MTARRQFAALLRWSGREWLRTRGLVLAVLAVLAAQAVSAFMAGLAVTEVMAQHRVFYAGLVRPALVFLLALTVVANAVRDLDDRVLETQLARPLARRTWYLAKLCGHGLAAIGLALLAALPLLPVAPADALLAWTFALACELLIVAALALACALALGHVAGAVSAVIAFYLLCRVIGASVLLAGTTLITADNPLNRAIAGGVGMLAAVLPDLSRYASGTWLVDGAPVADLAHVAVQSAVYVVLLAALGLFDFERRSL
jgi:hypothetical protein